MAQTTLSPMQLVHKAAMGLSLASLLAPVVIIFPAQAQTLRPAQPQGMERTQPPRSTTPTRSPMMRLTTGNEEPSPTANAGSCNGVNDCNNFIAICVGGGGTYVPGTHNGEGQPTSGSCKVD
ncbi:MAG: hypothetical protein HLUCCA11_20665 [Phormidesmis priestleyi Ana]|uniref:Uncharacterized protein n=1 Tax=Phormidesmis priestleyi Ana TaxID=1666911 RepID=A0A0P7YR54_9CYAN|nr:MAG: hypothetical protein HLUCCA11_20665 [Phormidesmis priestleyi Ana]